MQNLFLSYGRGDAAEFVDRLAHDLKTHTFPSLDRYEPWKDRVEMRSGVPWTDQIVEALRGVAGVVAVLSPHAVRTRLTSNADSVCLDEIAYARFAAQKPIIPVMLIQCEPPFEIFRLDYVDFTGWKEESKYRHSLEKLLASVAAALRGEVRYRRWNDRFQPWDFGLFLESKRQGFTGRKWLFEKIASWATQPGQPALLVVGDAGIGKSALVAEFVHRNDGSRVIAYHCCQANVPETLEPGRFVRSIAAMVASRHPGYEALLDQSPYREVLTERRCNEDPESAFEEGVLGALSRVGPPSAETRLLVVDALDEALFRRRKADVSIVQLLSQRMNRFPSWLRVLATSRGEPKVLQQLAVLEPLVVEASDPENLKDVENYIAGRAASEPLASKISGSGKSCAWVVATLSGLAKGNFLYAQQALDALATPKFTVADLGQLPPGLSEQFRWFFERQFDPAKDWPAVRRLLECLLAAQAPISEPELAAASELLEEGAVATALGSVRQYLRTTEDNPPRYLLFHKSLAEWLTDPRRSAEVYYASLTAGHRRVAEGLLASYRANRFQLSHYALTHLASHLASWARATKPGERVQIQEQLAAFVLDPVVQEQRANDPSGVNASFSTALDVLTEGPAEVAAPLVCEVAIGWQAFRRERLDGKRLFDFARSGQLDAFERELQLYPADEQWAAAARIAAAWLSPQASRPLAAKLREESRTGMTLDERVDAEFENRPPVFENVEIHPSEQEIADFFRHVGGTDAEGVSRSMLLDQKEPPLQGAGPDLEGVRYLAEFHAPVFVGFAQDHPELGTQRLRDYIALNAANAYRVYRNGSLWQCLCAVARHRDPGWVKEIAPWIVSTALAGGGREFGGATPLALMALRAASDPNQEALLQAEEQRLFGRVQNLAPMRGKGDSWGEFRRALSALAEARNLLHGRTVTDLLDCALAIPPGYAGFQAPACLTLAESLAICGADSGRVATALNEARVAAHNVQDLVFCARTTSRVGALADWWNRPLPHMLEIAKLVERFSSNPEAPEFSALHLVGETYEARRVVNPTSRLPGWFAEARSLAALARAYQWPVSAFVAANPEVKSPTVELLPGTRVRVPDPRWRALLAGYFSASLLRVPGFSREERVSLLLKLVPRAANNFTALDTVLGRLLLVFRPANPAVLSQLQNSLSSYAWSDVSFRAGDSSERAVYEPMT